MGKPGKRHGSKTTWDYKVVNGVEVQPVLYNGKSIGQRKLMAAITKGGELIRASDGSVRSYKSI